MQGTGRGRGLGRARQLQARLLTCPKPPRWSQAEQVAVLWGHAVTSTPPSLPTPREADPSESSSAQ